MADFSDANTVIDYVRFGRFRIEQLLGSDGMGRVEKAFDTVLRVTVALKTIRRELALSDPAAFAELRERFRREAIAGAQLRGSPYLVTVYELAIAGDTPYLVLEYVPGGDLRNLLKQRGVLPVGRALEILADAARGLGVMHAHNFVHRDVKPGNIFLTLDGRAKIGDFGIVQDGMTLRSPTSAKGHPYTAAYASPEQMTSTGYLRPQSDQYSLGVVLFEMLTGKRYRGLEADGVQRALAGLPATVVAIFSRMTAEDPDDRYPDMETVVNALTTVDYRPSPTQATDPFPREEGAAYDVTRQFPPSATGDTRQAAPSQLLPPGGPPPYQPPPQQPPPYPPFYPPPSVAPPPKPPPSSRRAVLIGAAAVLLGGMAGGAAFARSKGVLGGGGVVTVTPSAIAMTSSVPTATSTLAPSPTTVVVFLSPMPPTPLPPTLTPPLAPTLTATPPPPSMPTPQPPTPRPPTLPPPPPPTVTPRPPMPTPVPRSTAPATSGDLTIRANVVSANAAMVVTRDTTITVTFRNPTSGDKANWSYGFIFRKSDRQESYLALYSTGFWRKGFGTRDMNRMLVYDNRKQIEGIIVPMKLGENDTNDVQLILNNRVGELLVNGMSVVALNLGENGDAGDVQVGTGFSTSDQAGTVVHYSNFAVSAPTAPSAFAQRADGLIYGPAVGILRHDPMRANIVQVFPNVALRDGTIGARFFNPYAPARGAWDYGFQFRRSDTKLYRIVLFSDKSWKQYYAAKAATDMGFPSQSVTQVTSGMVAPLRTNAGDSNDVSLQIQGQSGTLRVNGVRIADLDLGANTDEGAVSIATGFDNQLAGEATRYEEFTIAP